MRLVGRLGELRGKSRAVGNFSDLILPAVRENGLSTTSKLEIYRYIAPFVSTYLPTNPYSVAKTVKRSAPRAHDAAALHDSAWFTAWQGFRQARERERKSTSVLVRRCVIEGAKTENLSSSSRGGAGGRRNGSQWGSRSLSKSRTDATLASERHFAFRKIRIKKYRRKNGRENRTKFHEKRDDEQTWTNAEAWKWRTSARRASRRLIRRSFLASRSVSIAFSRKHTTLDERSRSRRTRGLVSRCYCTLEKVFRIYVHR